jgi:hypothetical protein
MNAMCTKSEPFGQVVEGQEEMQFFDGIDGPSILLYLMQYPMDLHDPSCSFQRYNVWAPSDQIWKDSVHSKRRKLPYMVKSENAHSYTT